MSTTQAQKKPSQNLAIKESETTISTTGEDPVKTLNALLEQAKADGCHVLSTYKIHTVPALHTFSVRYVTLEPGPGITFPVQGGGLGLHRPAYNALGRNAGIQWVHKACGRTDDGRNPRYLEYEAVGKVKDQDGVWTTYSARKSIDLDVREEELRDSFREKVANRKANPRDEDETVRMQLLQIKKHMLALAETGAKNRVTEQILSLKKAWTVEELKHPFVVAALVPALDPTHEGDRQFIRHQAYGSADILYGEEKESHAHTAFPSQHQQNEAELPDEVVILEAQANHAETEDTEPEPEEDSSLVDFKNLDRAEKIKCLKDLAREKQYTEPFEKPYEKWNDPELIQFFQYLRTLSGPKLPWKK